MKNGEEKVETMCRRLLEQIEREMRTHQKGKPGLLTPAILVLVKEQVIQMMKNLDPKKFEPSYPQNLIGSWMEDPLGARLIELSYYYRKLK